MVKGGTHPTFEDPGARETSSLLRTLEETSGENTLKVQTLRKKITLSSSETRRRVEMGRARCLALDLGWMLVAVERTEGEEVLEKASNFPTKRPRGSLGEEER